MNSFPFALYDAFTDSAFGGSQATIITSARDINAEQRQRIAREIGMPATVFVDAHGEDWIQVQFMSAVMELPMCGHGTICLLTHMLDTEMLKWANPGSEVELRLPESKAIVSLSKNEAGRYLVMLDVSLPEFEPPPSQTGDLLKVLGITADTLAPGLPLQTVRGDFVHLVVPLTGLEAMRAIKPNFGGMIAFCHAHGIETIAVFCTEVEDTQNTIHVRDFCPAVGVSESAAAGTTNAALTSYLVRHELIPTNQEVVTVKAEQGLELRRPSSIKSIATLSEHRIQRLQVGGVATRVMDGRVYL